MRGPIRDSDGNIRSDLPEKCPKCGGGTEHCFGLAFGGYGGYVFCGDLDAEGEGCGWWAKEHLPPEEA